MKKKKKSAAQILTGQPPETFAYFQRVHADLHLYLGFRFSSLCGDSPSLTKRQRGPHVSHHNIIAIGCVAKALVSQSGSVTPCTPSRYNCYWLGGDSSSLTKRQRGPHVPLHDIIATGSMAAALESQSGSVTPCSPSPYNCLLAVWRQP